MKLKTGRVTINVLFVLTGFVLALFMAELVLALFYPQKVYEAKAPGIFFIQHDPEIGWVHKEGAAGVFTPSPAVPSSKVEINHMGCRGVEVARKKGPGTKRILFLGDSNTFGYGIAESQRYSDLLAQTLPPGFETVNLGVFGYATDQEALLLERKGLSFKPDIVVLGFSAGDLSENMSSVNAGASKPYCTIEGGNLALKNVPVPLTSPLLKSQGQSSRIKNFLYRHSHIYRLVLSRSRALNPYMTDSVLEMNEAEGMDVTVSIIDGMYKVCSENGARLVVLLISHGVWIDSMKKNPSLSVGYYPPLKQRLNRMEIPVIDTTDYFIRSGEKDLFFEKDPVHMTPAGNIVAARALHDGLVKLGMIPTK